MDRLTPVRQDPAPETSLVPATPPAQPDRTAAGPLFRGLLTAVLTGAALAGTSGAYLLAVRLLEWTRGLMYASPLTLWIFLAHVFLGILAGVFFVLLGPALLRRGPGAAAFVAAGLVVVLTGVALLQLDGLPRLPAGTLARDAVYLAHVAAPVLAAVLYVLHRRCQGGIRWRWGLGWSAASVLFVAVMGAVHGQRSGARHAAGPGWGEDLFEPSSVRTAHGKHIPAGALMKDEYCKRCHEDIYNDWFHSAHHFASFNNPVYRFSVRETRGVALARDGNVRVSRWCAGCHDPVPLLSGAFDDPRYDDVNDPTAHAGVTCTVCHAITHVNSTVGNGDYTIAEPTHYPLAFSQSPLLRWLSDQAVKGKPDFHQKTFLKPLHSSKEFCSTCHKVSLPMELNHYKELLRGQNHYDTFLLSGASGHGARGFYYPAPAKTLCNDCHMPLKASKDFGARDHDGSGRRSVHSHLFPGANTGVPVLAACEPGQESAAAGLRRAAGAHADFLRGTDPQGKDRSLRIDIFGIKEGGKTDGRLTAPLRPELPRLKPGGQYLIEVVLRTLNVGHQFPQGTVDSNEIWVDFEARSGGRVLGRSGGMAGPGDAGRVDAWAHFVNALVLDREGRRINRHNPQDIFTALYDHQIPAGAAQVVHYALQVPSDVKAPVELKVRLRYRKFDHEYTSLVCVGVVPEFPAMLAALSPDPVTLAGAGLLQHRLERMPRLPVVDLCEDRVTLPFEGAPDVPRQSSPIEPAWQRWNDYGIGCYLEGGPGSKKGELRQAEEAFRHLLTLPEKEAHAHAYLNLARVYFDEGRLSEAAGALNQARANDPPAPWWTVTWLTGMVNAQQGHLDEAVTSLEQVLDPRNQPRDRTFDFTKDHVILNELANALFKRAQQEGDRARREAFLRRAAEQYEATLRLDREDLDAHYGLSQCYAQLGEPAALSAATRPIGVVTRGQLQALAQRFADNRLPTAHRLEAATELEGALAVFAEQRPDPIRPKLPVLLGLIETCRGVRGGKAEGPLPAAAARLLGQLHRRTHQVLRPDDNARDRAVRLYRERHPAADHAAQPIVIYPLHRAGALGLSPP